MQKYYEARLLEVRNERVSLVNENKALKIAIPQPSFCALLPSVSFRKHNKKLLSDFTEPASNIHNCKEVISKFFGINKFPSLKYFVIEVQIDEDYDHKNKYILLNSKFHFFPRPELQTFVLVSSYYL